MHSISASETLLNTVRSFLATGNDDGPYAVGYSGGRDSTVLLWALVQVLGPESVVALYVDHGWREEGERQTERHLVEQTCRRLGVALMAFAPPGQILRTEAGARQHRFACFSSYLTDHPTAAVFLAHHADDQAETVLMRLLKGRSWLGLEGMAARRGAFRRPLLSTRAEVVGLVAAQQKLVWHEDSTNGAAGPARNHLRLAVLPLLRERYPRVIASLNEFSQAWKEVAPVKAVDPRWERRGAGWEIDAERWDQWRPLTRQAQLLALANRAGRDRPLSRRSLEVLCQDGKSGRASGSGWRWVRRKGVITWSPAVADASSECWIEPRRDCWYQLDGYRWCWTDAHAASLAVPSVDPSEPWVWRTVVPGLPLGSVDTPLWGRSTRRHRLGGGELASLVVILQQGLVRAVIDPLRRRLVWVETTDEKLHKAGIFVTLIAVTRNLTE